MELYTSRDKICIDVNFLSYFLESDIYFRLHLFIYLFIYVFVLDSLCVYFLKNLTWVLFPLLRVDPLLDNLCLLGQHTGSHKVLFFVIMATHYGRIRKDLIRNEPYLALRCFYTLMACEATLWRKQNEHLGKFQSNVKNYFLCGVIIFPLCFLRRIEATHHCRTIVFIHTTWH